MFQPAHNRKFLTSNVCLKAFMALWPLEFLTVPLFSLCSFVHADQLKVAVASNFAHVVEILEASFQADTGHTLDVHYGASGDLKALVF